MGRLKQPPPTQWSRSLWSVYLLETGGGVRHLFVMIVYYHGHLNKYEQI